MARRRKVTYTDKEGKSTFCLQFSKHLNRERKKRIIYKFFILLVKFVLSSLKALGSALIVLGSLMFVTIIIPFYLNDKPLIYIIHFSSFIDLVNIMKYYIFWATWIFGTWINLSEIRIKQKDKCSIEK